MADDTFQANNPDDTNPATDLQSNQRLPEDGPTPFSPPDGAQDRIGSVHQSTDTNIDSHEHYDEGIEGAAGIDLPGQAADESAAPPPSDLT